MDFPILKRVQFLVNSSVSYQIWKETEPELAYYFERVYSCIKTVIGITSDLYATTVDLQMPENAVERFEKDVKSSKVNIEIDKIHGVDPASGKPDVKISKVSVVDIAPLPAQKEMNGAIVEMEDKLVELEVRERSRTIDIKGMLTLFISYAKCLWET